MGVHRIWHHGLIPVEGKRPLDALRNRLIHRARQYEEGPFRYDVTDLGCSDDGGSRRCDLRFGWSAEDGRFTVRTQLSLCYHAGEDRVSWLITAACTRPWRYGLEPPARRVGLEELGASGADEIPIDSPALPMHGWSREECDRMGDLLGEALASDWRTSAVLILSEPPTRPISGWPGLVSVFDVDDRFRRTLNGFLPLGCTVPLGARLFVPPRDDLPDFIDTTCPPPAEQLEAAITRLIQARSRLPLPEEWADVPSVREWWALDPFATPQLPPDVELTGRLDRAERELAEARGVITILRRRSASDNAEYVRVAAQAKTLQGRLNELVSVDTSALRSQVTQLQHTVDDYARAFDEVETERDELRRTNGLLAAALARIAEDDDSAEPGLTDFPSFTDLIEAASTTLPHLDITAEPAPAAILDHHPKAAAWRRKAWDALRTLEAYAQARKALLDAGQDPGPELSDVLAFARTGQPGSLISANIIALTESDTVTTNERLRQARTFRVQPETNPAGRDYFGAHIALERFKPPAPRLHFLDDLDGTGHIYIGYLGAHLPTSKTN